HDEVRDPLHGRCRYGENGNVHRFRARIAGQPVERANHETVAPCSDLGRVAVIDSPYLEAALREPTILGQRQPDLPGTNDDHAPFALDAEDLTNPAGKLNDRVAETALAKRSEEREVLSHLRRGRAASRRQLGTGNRIERARLELLEKEEVQRQSPNGGLCYVLHCVPGLVNFFTS